MTAINQHADIVHSPIVKSLVWQDETQTRIFAQQLAQQELIRDCFVELHGELGAGKTSFARYLLQALGVTGRVKSPTYAVVETYTVAAAGDAAPPLHIWHFDFYRFKDPHEWEDAGFRDLFASPGLKIAEWPEQAGVFLPRADLVIRIEVGHGTVRHVSLLGQTARGAALAGDTCP
ncbi:MAG: tRNA (adenosine(37)-N6)-threonylcarbamoyltransferase complex ATPase subunit type 1 TsaE [Rhodoferax sp.]|nr:tRNA (adenosine(37)-N6)-threonylcarbamoyltransferase complex ATPase subunit type 1 TsaE [Rhodoferax sp.]